MAPTAANRGATTGVTTGAAGRIGRRYCSSCIDWTERRPHISGAVGAGLAHAFLGRSWIARIPDSRALTVTAGGRKKLAELGVAGLRETQDGRMTALPVVCVSKSL